MLVVHESATENMVIEMCKVGIDPAFVRFGHQITPIPPPNESVL
jgi:hypothetical protein